MSDRCTRFGQRRSRLKGGADIGEIRLGMLPGDRSEGTGGDVQYSSELVTRSTG
ncbi:hypothetical protein [Streptomyces tubercidicus]|uniref:hypothetical protein n=1 Tax=Streptomyces tubercidicus TaxID=47759 RepID=UPI0034677C18